MDVNPLTILTETLTKFMVSSIENLPQIIAGICIFLIGWLINRIFSRAFQRVMKNAKMRESLKQVIDRIISIGIWVITLTMTIVVVFPSVNLGSAIAALGFGSIAIGFAFKDIFENFLAGIIILWQLPFEDDDFITVDGIEGYVEKILLRCTILRKVDGERVVIPNSVIFKNPVYIQTYEKHRRITVICGVAYGEDVDVSRGVIKAAVEKCKTLVPGHEVQIFAREFGSSSIDFEVTWWTGSTPLSERQSRDEVVAAVKRALDDAGIEIPFPYRTLTFKGDSPLKIINTATPANVDDGT